MAKSPIAKLKDLVGPLKADALEAAPTEDLLAEVSKASSRVVEIRQAAEADEGLAAAKAEARDLAAPYRESERRESAVGRLALHYLAERGHPLGRSLRGE